MSFVDRMGVQVRPRVVRRANPCEAQKARDMAICRMRRDGQGWRAIGIFLGLSHEGARKRFKALPEAVRDFYGRAVG